MEPLSNPSETKQKRKYSLTEDEIPNPDSSIGSFINLTTHNEGSTPIPVNWGEDDPMVRGPIIATTRHVMQRNAIGAHSGSYSIYRGLAVAQNKLDSTSLPNLSLTHPAVTIGPFPSWSDPTKIATFDPFGHIITEAFAPYFRRGYDIRPTIAVTRAHIEIPEVKEALRVGRLVADGTILKESGQVIISKAAVEPVWFLPEIARRFGTTEEKLRQALYNETNMMYPELITRMDLKVFLPPIGGFTVYIFGNVEDIPDESIPLTVRVHDECNGSDVFGSDICTCRPYLTHAIEECIRTAQQGGTGVCIYFRKEGRALGEVTKYLVYNKRKRQEGGDLASEYFNCTRHVAGVTDTRFQSLMPDALHWLGVTKIHRFISMSDMKYNAIVDSGIQIEERVPIPPELVPEDAQVEITAKVYEGYHAGNEYSSVDEESLNTVKGREYKNGESA
jgi:GTP cyclohydrolase II